MLMVVVVAVVVVMMIPIPEILVCERHAVHLCIGVGQFALCR